MLSFICPQGRKKLLCVSIYSHRWIWKRAICTGNQGQECKHEVAHKAKGSSEQSSAPALVLRLQGPHQAATACSVRGTCGVPGVRPPAALHQRANRGPGGHTATGERWQREGPGLHGGPRLQLPQQQQRPTCFRLILLPQSPNGTVEEPRPHRVWLPEAEVVQESQTWPKSDPRPWLRSNPWLPLSQGRLSGRTQQPQRPPEPGFHAGEEQGAPPDRNDH